MAPVTFTRDHGVTRAPLAQPRDATDLVYGVVAASIGSTLAAFVRRGVASRLEFSVDAGCSWADGGHTIGEMFDAHVATAGDRVYVWGTGRAGTPEQPSSTRVFYVIEPGEEAVRREIPSAAGYGLYGFAVDPGNPNRIRAVVYTCTQRASCGHGSEIVESLDGGATWLRSGQRAPYDASYDMAFSPVNLDHVIAPPYVTFDGGNQWLSMQGLSAEFPDGMAMGPDGQSVWLLLVALGPNAPETASLYLSRDGGLNFQLAITGDADGPLAYGAGVHPDPSDADVVYLSYTSDSAQTSYFYRYDAALDELSKAQWPSADGVVTGVTFNPADPAVVYLGLSAP
jgi:hypothetical protein